MSTNMSDNRPSDCSPWHSDAFTCRQCEPSPEPWCRECGVPIVDKAAHDRWHARFEGAARPLRLAGHRLVGLHQTPPSGGIQEFRRWICGCGAVGSGYRIPTNLACINDWAEHVLASTNGSSTPSDSSVTRSEVSTNLSGNDPSRSSS